MQTYGNPADISSGTQMSPSPDEGGRHSQPQRPRNPQLRVSQAAAPVVPLHRAPGVGGVLERGAPRAISVLNAGGTRSGWTVNALFVIGAIGIAASGVIHWHLWASGGYRQIPSIGPAFLAQAIAGVTVGLVLAVLRRTWIALVGAVLAASTIGGFLLAATVGVFGFTDSWTAPYATLAFVTEVVTVVSCLGGVAACSWRFLRPAGSRRVPVG